MSGSYGRDEDFFNGKRVKKILLLNIKIDEEPDFIIKCKLISERDSLLKLTHERKTETYKQMVVRLNKEYEDTVFSLATLRDSKGLLFSNETVSTIRKMSYYERVNFQNRIYKKYEQCHTN